MSAHGRTAPKRLWDIGYRLKWDIG